MARGGKRQGAGRRPGSITKRTQEIVAAASKDGETPLEYMLRVMRTSGDDKRKDAMAIAAAPFMHPRLAAIEHSGNEEKPLGVQILTGVPATLIAHANGDDASPPKGH